MTASTLPPALEAVLDQLRAPRYRVAASVMALALARVLYHRRQRHRSRLQLHRAVTRHLAESADHAVAVDVAGARENQPESLTNPVEEWHEVAADGAQTQSLVYYPVLGEAEEEQDVLVLVLPGNPGVPHFLVPLMRELAAGCDRRFEVRCFSQTGHVMPWKNGGRVFSLQEQVQHKLHYVGARLRENPSLRIVLVGHSIGTYLALQIAAAFPDAIERLVLMQPTISNMRDTPKGRSLNPLFAFRNQATGLIKAVEYVTPMALRRWIVRRAVGDDTETVLQFAAMLLVDATVMKNVFYMALRELEEVLDLDDSLIRPHEAKTLFIYSPIDGWVPSEFVQDYQLRFPLARHRVVPQGHAFMMEPNGSRDMAAHIAPWLDGVGDREPADLTDVDRAKATVDESATAA